MFDQIEKIKSEYTDKYVAVDPSRAELARFKDLVGQVKTVNMSGRALVEFIDYNLSTGWFDIDLDYLKVVDKPAPKPKEEKKPAAKKAAPKKAADKPKADGEKKLSPLELARQQGSAGKEAVAKANKPSSTADILAAARGGAKAETEAAPKAKKAAPAASAPAKPAASDKPAKVDRSKMSVADMLAAARGGAGPAAKEEAPADEPEPEVEEQAAEESAEEAAPEPAAAAPSGGKVDKASMSVDEMIAYCRQAVA
ncbi:MAG: hypothetical protein RID07_09845 [Lacipirellulaceae bacterium]